MWHFWGTHPGLHRDRIRWFFPCLMFVACLLIILKLSWKIASHFFLTLTWEILFLHCVFVKILYWHKKPIPSTTFCKKCFLGSVVQAVSNNASVNYQSTLSFTIKHLISAGLPLLLAYSLKSACVVYSQKVLSWHKWPILTTHILFFSFK